ncbi:hypothetical protein VCR15J5_470112 [Vibrio crassostreae]|nr:hypothetical protein VCR15J5_470112 [Vibrio crassostreae]
MSQFSAATLTGWASRVLTPSLSSTWKSAITLNDNVLANMDNASFVFNFFALEKWEAIGFKLISLPTQSKFYISSNDKSSPVKAAFKLITLT